MSSQRFAPLTSNLFARKGDAGPSAPKPSLFWTREPPVAPEPDTPPPPPPIDRPHRMMVMLSASEFERLGIAAVKKGMTRHQILRAALDAHLVRLKREYGGCGCMAMGGNCQDGCGAP
ncbi:MAG: hypothetical protein WDM86_13150 [Rhizomicrobium sp.]